MTTLTSVTCPNAGCGRTCNIKEEQVGRRLRCPHCRAAFVVTSLLSGAEHSVATSFAEWRPASIPKSIGRFQVLEWLGTGGFGTVYRAFDPQMQRDVALKVPLEAMRKDPRAIERLLREARSAGNLRHAHIVPVYEVSGDEEQPYIASAFIDGRTLEDLVSAGPLSARQAAQIVHDLADALAYAHEQHIVHRDVKSSNVILDGRGAVHLMDFGLACHQEQEDSFTSDGDFAGTAAYVAPEQLSDVGNRNFTAGDQYSLGVILYETLTGQLPFEGPAAVVLHNVVHSEPTPPGKLRPDIPRELETICRRAMAKDPKERYGRCAELAADLGRWLNDQPIRQRRMKKIVAVCTGAALLLAAVLVAMHLLPILESGSSPPDNTGPAAVPPDAGPKDKSPPALPAARKPDEKELWRDVVLVMTFDKDTFYPKAGKTYVRDLSGHAHDGLCDNVEFTPLGKVRGGLLCNGGQVQLGKSLINGETNYTITAWCRWAQSTKAPHALYQTVRTERFDEPLYGISLSPLPDQVVWVTAWNAGHEKYWLNVKTNAGVIPQDEWFFFAVSLAEGATSTGKLRVIVNDTVIPLSSQMVKQETEGWSDLVGLGMKGAVIDELAVWRRALSDEELADLRTRGATKGIGGPPRLPASDPFEGSGSANRILVTADGRRVLAAGGKHSLSLWNAETGKLIRVFDGHREGIPVWGLALSADEKQALTGADDQVVILWDLESGKERRFPGIAGGQVMGLAFLPDGKHALASGGENDLVLFSLESGEPVRRFSGHKGQTWALALSADGTRALSSGRDETVRLWDVGKGEELFTLSGHKGIITALAFSPDGERALSGGEDKIVRLWDLKSGKELLGLEGHQTHVASVAFLPDGRHALASGLDGIVRLWDLATGKQIFQRSTGNVFFRLTSDGRRVLSGGGDLRLWRLPDWAGK